MRYVRTRRRSVGEAEADSPVRLRTGADRNLDTTVVVAGGSNPPEAEAGLASWSVMWAGGRGMAQGQTRGRVVLGLTGIVIFVGHGAGDGDEERGWTATCPSLYCRSALKCHSRAAFPRSNWPSRSALRT